MTHPYQDAPGYRRWRSAMSEGEIDPVVSFPFRITAADRIVSAGSCFAQHIANRLKGAGFNYFVPEKPHPILHGDIAKNHQYGVYSARYGNIYSSRQLLQLLMRAFGHFKPEVTSWPSENGFVDPFRPVINPDGFRSERELEVDREQHFKSVRRAFRHANVFIFTLGLTEIWTDSKDGAVYPLCPGVAGGTFDPERHRFHNLSTAEVVSDMKQAISFLRRKNPALKIVLTVSPVPLMATAENRHVLVSTVQSKARLLAATDEICRMFPDVVYFPSFEIITGPHANYYEPDFRSVREEGVAHVMRIFFKHATDGAKIPSAVEKPAAAKRSDPAKVFARVSDVLCEEVLLDMPAENNPAQKVRAQTGFFGWLRKIGWGTRIRT